MEKVQLWSLDFELNSIFLSCLTSRSRPPPTLEGQQLAKVEIKITPTQNYAQVDETLCFEPDPAVEAHTSRLVGAGKESRFIHGMDEKSMITKFLAKIYYKEKIYIF